MKSDTPQLLLENQYCFPLYSAANAVVRAYRPLLEELDLTYLQYMVLMVLWEESSLNVKELGARLGLDSGTLLGTPQPGVADLACAALWISIDDTLPKLGEFIAEHAPCVYALSHRIAATPAIRDLRARQRARWGDVWCEGQIEASLRSVLATWQR